MIRKSIFSKDRRSSNINSLTQDRNLIPVSLAHFFPLSLSLPPSLSLSSSLSLSLFPSQLSVSSSSEIKKFKTLENKSLKSSFSGLAEDNFLTHVLFCPCRHFVCPLKQGHSLYLPCIFVNYRNGCSNPAKCSYCVGPGGQANTDLCVPSLIISVLNQCWSIVLDL